MRLDRSNYPVIPVGDIHDAYGFVAAHVLKIKGVPLFDDANEIEDLIAEGMTILLELHKAYEPHRPGYDTPGRFSGYASFYLPKRLQNVWRRMHPEHLQRKRPDGKRVIEYGVKPLSLDHRADADGENDNLAGQFAATSCLPGHATSDLIDHAITRLNGHGSVAAGIVEHLSTGARTDIEIASIMRLERVEVTQSRRALASAITGIRDAA